ncbi:hypothetical protein [Paenibacillus chitinolyticus]|uniref:hypothetical protein n=1 Tax=Paenibacillus chitinolyticus TaxID=79263 RepID=UPI003D05ABFC
MQWEEINEENRITKLASQPASEGECLLTWQWPKEVAAVYVYSFESGSEEAPEQLAPHQLKLFTREEYKAAGGYRERMEYIGMRGYRIFPCVMKDGRVAPYRQTGTDNTIRVSAGKARIRYSIKYGGRLFGKYKSAKIQLFCEIPVPQEALCYVKKEGGHPAGRQDGTAYPFRRDFEAGTQTLPEIEIGKHDFLRLFFTDSRYGDVYELIQE